MLVIADAELVTSAAAEMSGQGLVAAALTPGRKTVGDVPGVFTM